MRKFIKFIAAACAAAIFTGSVSAVSFASGTGTKSVAIAAQEGTKSVKITTEETIPFDGVVIYAVYEGQTLSSVEAKTFKDISSEKEGEVQFDKDYTKTNSKLFVWSSLSEMIPYNVTVTPEKVQINTVAKVEISGDKTAPATLNATVSAINDSGFEDTSAFIYEWKKGEEILSETGSILEDAAEGNYTVTATYTGTGNYEGSITITAPYVVSPEGDTRADITGDDTVSVSINASSQTAPSNLTAQISAGETALAVNDFTYVWSRNGSPISGGENGTLENVQAGEYTVVATVKPDNASYKGSTAASQAVTVKAVYTVTWSVEGDTTQETYVEGEMPSYSGTPSKDQTNTDTYEFTGWTPEITAVTGDITYTAQFSASKRSYNVTYNTNGGTIANETNYTSYTCGTALTLPIPTRNGYTFGGWYEESDFNGTPVKTIDAEAYGDKEYFAKWNSNEPDKFTITWKNDDGSTIKTTQVSSGVMPVFDGNNPTKADTAQYTYTFAGWTPEVIAATADAEYTATFTPTTRSYKITWVVAGKENKEEDVEYGVTPEYGEMPTREATAEYTYTFKEWSPEIAAVTGTQTYTATWNEVKNKYTVTWKDGNNTLKTEQIAYGETPEYSGDAPTKEGYSYTWTPEITEVTGNATYTTNWTINKYTVTNNSATDDDGTKHGTITLNGLDGDGKAEYNSTIKVTPSAAEGYELKKITVNGADITKPVNGVWQFTIPASDVAVTATFEKAVKSITVEGASRVQKGKTSNYTAKVTAVDDTDVTAVYASDIEWSVDEASTGAGTTIENGTLAVNSAQTSEITVTAKVGEVSDTATVTPTTQRPDALKIVSAEDITNHLSNNAVAANAIDGDTATNYNAITQDPSENPTGRTQTYMTVDLGAVKKVSNVQIWFYAGNARKYNFDIRVSKDGIYWEKINTFESSGTTANGFETFDFGKTVSVRYVRYVGHGAYANANSTFIQYNAIQEFEVYGSDTATDAAELLTSSDTQITASAYLNADQAPSKAVDGDKTTQWNAMMTNTEPNTLTIDLLAKQSVSAVELLFYQPWIRSHKFKIEVSADGYEWITVANYVENGVGYTVGEAYDDGERITFTAQTARYIRFVGYGSTLNNGTQNTYNPVREFRVYGTGPKSLTLTASAENEHGGTTASYAVDGIIGKLEDTTTDSRWSAMMITDTRPENKITFDLGEEKKISAVAISFYLGNARSYNFDIEVSSKGDTWTKVLENKDSGAKVDKEYEAFEFEETTARYVRYIGRGATELSGGVHNNYSSFWEFRVYGYDNE